MEHVAAGQAAPFREALLASVQVESERALAAAQPFQRRQDDQILHHDSRVGRKPGVE